MEDFKVHIILLIILSSFLNCSPKIDISNTVFKVENIGDKEILFTHYKKIGFKLIHDDVTTFEKKNKDTIVQLFINDDLKTIDRKLWKIKLKSTNRKDIENWVFNHKALFITPTFEDRINSDYKYFSLIKQVDHKIFTCRIKQEYGIDYLLIEYHYPLKGKNLKNNIEYYKKDYDRVFEGRQYKLNDKGEYEFINKEEVKMIYDKE